MKKLFIAGLIMFLVFFALGSAIWFGVEAHGNQVKTIEKSYSQNNIKRINVHSDGTNVIIKKGQRFHVHYEGKSNINFSNQNETLQISDSQNDKKRILNLNPFDSSQEQLIITVPPQKLDELNINTRVGDVALNDVQSHNATIWNEANGEITLNHCKFDETNINANESFVKMKNSQLSNSEINVDKGKIMMNNALVHKSVFKVERGSMELNKMKPECDFKGSVNHGNITMRYLDAPKDVMLKLSPEKGKINVNTPGLHQGENGTGKHLIELYTNHGDISID